MIELPPNHPRRFDVQLTAEPRGMIPVFFSSHDVLLTLVAIPMETVREFSQGRCKETEIARRNLQIWINHLGPALYNPVMWLRHPVTGKLHIRGMHRTMALKALDFDFIYVYLTQGNYHRVSSHVNATMARNTRPSTMSTRPGQCAQCHKQIVKYWKLEHIVIRHYRCVYCGHEGMNHLPYPKPI